jgi:CBS domain-containing protein
MRCEDVMTAEVEVVGPKDTVELAACKMRDLNVGFLPVCREDGSVIGILTDRDIALRVIAQHQNGETRVEDVMTTDVVSCEPRTDLRSAENLMRVNQVNRLVVLDEEGRLAGVLSLSDLAHYEDPRRVGELASDITDREIGPHH